MENKVLRILAVSIFVMSLASCGGGNNLNDPSSTNTTNTGNGSAGSNNTGQSKSITLAWIAPSTRVNGNPISLTEIAGYKISYGPSEYNITNVVTINDGSLSQYTLTLQTGVYYIEISAIDSDGVESPRSTSLMVTL